jgi:hypothetical protein
MSPVRTASTSFLVPQLKSFDERAFAPTVVKQQSFTSAPSSAAPKTAPVVAAAASPTSPASKSGKPASNMYQDDNHPFSSGDITVEALFECREANYLLYDILRHDLDTQNRHDFDRAVKEGVMNHLRGVAGLRVRDSDVWIQMRPGIASRLLLSHPGNGGMPTISDGQWPLRFRFVVCTVPTEEATTRRHLFGLPNNVFDKAFGLYELWFGRAVIGSPVTLVDTYSPATLVNGMQQLTSSSISSSPEQRQKFMMLRDQHHQHAAAWSTSVEAPRQELPVVAGMRNDAMQISATSTQSLFRQPATTATTSTSFIEHQPHSLHYSNRQASLESVGLLETTIDNAARQPSVSIDYGSPGSSMAPDVQQYRKHPSILPPRRYFSKEHLVHPSTMGGTLGMAEDTTTTAPQGTARVAQQPERTSGTPRSLQSPTSHAAKQLSDDDDDEFDRYGRRLSPVNGAARLETRPSKAEDRHRGRYSPRVAPLHRDRRYDESPARQRQQESGHGQQRGHRSRQYEQRYADAKERHPDDLSFSDISESDEIIHRPYLGDERQRLPAKLLSPRRHRYSPRSRERGPAVRSGAVAAGENQHNSRDLYTNREGTEFFVRVRPMSPPLGEEHKRGIVSPRTSNHQPLRQIEDDNDWQRGSPASGSRHRNRRSKQIY